jgi:hypothetical protein
LHGGIANIEGNERRVAAEGVYILEPDLPDLDRDGVSTPGSRREPEQE